jgi:hypothetical protein
MGSSVGSRIRVRLVRRLFPNAQGSLVPKPQSQFTRVMQWTDGTFVEWEDRPSSISTKDAGINLYVGYKRIQER